MVRLISNGQCKQLITLKNGDSMKKVLISFMAFMCLGLFFKSQAVITIEVTNQSGSKVDVRVIGMQTETEMQRGNDIAGYSEVKSCNVWHLVDKIGIMEDGSSKKFELADDVYQVTARLPASKEYVKNSDRPCYAVPKILFFGDERYYGAGTWVVKKDSAGTIITERVK